MSESIKRYGDMSPTGHLLLYQQDDGDIIVCAVPDVKDAELYRLPPLGVAVEFCTCCGGGGQSPHTRKALIALWKAIERDNKENPQQYSRGLT